MTAYAKARGLFFLPNKKSCIRFQLCINFIIMNHVSCAIIYYSYYEMVDRRDLKHSSVELWIWFRNDNCPHTYGSEAGPEMCSGPLQSTRRQCQSAFWVSDMSPGNTNLKLNKLYSAFWKCYSVELFIFVRCYIFCHAAKKNSTSGSTVVFCTYRYFQRTKINQKNQIQEDSYCFIFVALHLLFSSLGFWAVTDVFVPEQTYTGSCPVSKLARPKEIKDVVHHLGFGDDTALLNNRWHVPILLSARCCMRTLRSLGILFRLKQIGRLGRQISLRRSGCDDVEIFWDFVLCQSM
jgi:hypothetical protein